MGTHLTLAQAGVAFPARARARVFSVHARALNLEQGGAAELLTLTTDPGAMTVSSALYRSGPGFTGFDRLGLDRGDSVQITPDGIASSRVRITVDSSLADSARFDGTIAPHAETASTLDLLTGALIETGGDRGLASLAHGLRLSRRGAPLPQPVGSDLFAQEAWRRLSGDPEGGCEESLPGLLGLGAGFTPAGDDFIVGFLAARATCSRPVGRGAERAIEARLGSTTRPGATIVSQALRGAFPNYLCRFATGPVGVGAVSATAAGDGMLRLVGEAATHGSTSGLDALTGFAFGLL